MRTRAFHPGLALLLGLAWLTGACSTQLGIVSIDEAFATPVEGRRIVLQGLRTRLESVKPPLDPPTLWYSVDVTRRSPWNVIGPTAGFTLSFLVENESAKAWTIRRTDFGLSTVGGKHSVEFTALAVVESFAAGANGDSSVLLTLPPGGSASLRVNFAITYPATEGAQTTAEVADPWKIDGSELFGKIYRLRINDPTGELLMQRHIELGEWSQSWQGARAALLATLVFLIMGALA